MLHFNPLPDDKILDWNKLQKAFYSAFQMKNTSHIVRKTLREKKKLLVTTNFSFSLNVFHCYVFLVCQNAALCGNGFIVSLK